MEYYNLSAIFKRFIRFNFVIILLFTLGIQFFSPLTTLAQTTRQLEKPKPVQGNTERRIALVIGNSKYQNITPLSNPANDAHDIAETLKGLGFEVILKENVKKDEMQLAIIEFGEKLAATKGVGVFYYAGHGIQVSGSNYLIPVEINKVKKSTELKVYAVDVNEVLYQMEDAKNPLNIVILDACRDDPFASGSRSIAGDGLAQIIAPKGTLIAYATSPGKTASDGNGRNGLYTSELIKQMKVPNVLVETMFNRVGANVAQLSENEQVPWTSQSPIAGEFYFNKVSEAVKANNENKKSASTDQKINLKIDDSKAIESEFLSAIKNSNNQADYLAFIKEFPQSEHIAEVKSILEQLAYDSIKNSSNKSDLQKYLDEFPNGAHAPLARMQLSKIEPGENRQLSSAVDKNLSTDINKEKLVISDPKAIENEAWESIKDEKTADIFRTFLKEYPKGENADKAKIRLEEIAWESAKYSWEKAKVKAYLDEFPQGKHLTEANKMLDKIAWDAIKDTTDKAKIQAYKNEFPQGEYISLANIRLEKLDLREGSNSGELGKGIKRNSTGIQFLYVEPGEFLMGASDAEINYIKQSDNKKLTFVSDEAPQREMKIAKGFWLSIFEITQAQWESVMENNPSANKLSNCQQCPVDSVSWDDVKEFIRKMNEKNDGWEYRLPTEAEWEYAARAGTKTAFAFGDSLNSNQANFDGTKPFGEETKTTFKNKTVEVGSYAPNPWGFYDMHGNVAEWCEDVYTNNLSNLPGDGSANLKGDSTQRVIRGGSYWGSGLSCRSANRDPYSSKFQHIGFRLAAQIKN